MLEYNQYHVNLQERIDSKDEAVIEWNMSSRWENEGPYFVARSWVLRFAAVARLSRTLEFSTGSDYTIDD